MLKKTLAIATSTAIIFGASMAYSANNSRGEAMFKKADTNSDGAISKEEFMAKNEAKFKKIDANSDGKISLEEFTEKRDAAKAKIQEKKAAAEKETESQEE